MLDLHGPWRIEVSSSYGDGFTRAQAEFGVHAAGL
jgi:hypothetical protein